MQLKTISRVWAHMAVGETIAHCLPAATTIAHGSAGSNPMPCQEHIARLPEAGSPQDNAPLSSYTRKDACP
jgi:hypothetical protein